MTLTVEERLERYRTVLDNADSPRQSEPELERHEKTPRRLLTAAACLLLAAAIVGMVAIQRREDSAPPLAAVVTGTWRQGAPPPFVVTQGSQTAVTDDGRVVVISGPGHAVAEPLRGGVYDPIADTWQAIPVAPFNGEATVKVVGSTLVAVTDGETGPSAAALLDLTRMTWTSIDIPDVVGGDFLPWTWNGETLAIVNTDAPTSSGSTAAPVTMRWSLSDQTWRTGSPPPLTSRSSPTRAVTPDRIAIWGGTPSAATTATAPAVLTDGAIYDVATDQWTPIAAEESLSNIAKAQAQALLVGDALTLVSAYEGSSLRTAATYRSGHWTILPSPTATGFLIRDHFDTVVIKADLETRTVSAQYLDLSDSTWKDAPGQDIVRTSRGLTALSTSPDNPGSGPIQAWVLSDSNWQPTQDAPTVNRMGPAVATVGDLVIVIGGDQGPDLKHQNDTWVLDLSKSPDSSESDPGTSSQDGPASSAAVETTPHDCVNPGGQALVPNVAGMPYADAVAALASAGLETNPFREVAPPDATDADYAVVGQKTAPGTTTSCGTIVDIVVAYKPGVLYIIQDGDSYESIAVSQGMTLEQLLAYSGLTVAELEASGQGTADPLPVGRALRLGAGSAIPNTAPPATP